VDTAEALDRRSLERPDRCEVGDVSAQSDDFGARCGDRLDGRVQCSFLDVCKYEARAGSREATREGEADPAGASCDHDDLVRQSFHCVTSIFDHENLGMLTLIPK
jgi:hypothetical protein